MNDRDFVAAFEKCAIAATDFHHADHVRLRMDLPARGDCDRGHRPLYNVAAALRRPSRRPGPVPRDHHLGLSAAYPRAYATRWTGKGLGILSRREWRSLRLEAVDPGALLHARDAQVGPC